MPPATVIFLRGLFGYCPNCGQRRMFQGIYALHDHCPHCRLQFENRPGDFTGTAYLNSGISGFISVMIGVAALLLTEFSATTIIAALLPVSVLIASLLHQPIKGLWIALMFFTEAIRPSDGGSLNS